MFLDKSGNDESPEELDLYELEAAIAIAEIDSEAFLKIQKKIRRILGSM